MNAAMTPSFDCVSHRSRIESWEGLEDAQETFLPSPLFLVADDEETLWLLIEKEGDYMPRQGYAERLRNRTVDLDARLEAVAWILKVHSLYGFGPLTAYLAVNYLDRFLAMGKLPQGTRAWMFQLVSVACLSLAAKMADTHVPLLPDLQGEDARFIFDAHTIQRMELLILTTLQWRMRSVTPFSFLDYFASLAVDGGNPNPNPNPPPTALIWRAVELIVSIIKEIDLLDYKPSAIAAAAVLCAVEEVAPLEAALYKRVVSSFSNVDKERMFGCYNLMQESMMEHCFTSYRKNSGGSLTTAKTPTGVLDAGGCFSDKSSTTRASSLSVEPYAKRRKLNELCRSLFVYEAQPC